MRELTRMELAGVKRIAANTKSLRNKVEKLNAKIAELENTRESFVEEIKMWEAPIMEKYGYSVDEILSGDYLAETEETEEIPAELPEGYDTDVNEMYN